MLDPSGAPSFPHPSHDPGTADDGAVETLEHVGRVLTRIVRLIEVAGGAEREHLAGPIGAVLEAHGAAIRGMAAAGWTAPDPQGIASWLHDLRNLVNGLLGWAHVLGRVTRDEATRLRAAEAIDRTAKLLTQLLAQPPG
jgi:signal transduction histidine kinase